VIYPFYQAYLTIIMRHQGNDFLTFDQTKMKRKTANVTFNLGFRMWPKTVNGPKVCWPKQW
jgi:hypothetical protein